MENITGSITIDPEVAKAVEASAKHIAGFRQTLTDYPTQNTTHLLDVVLLCAITLGASDIHLEPEKEKTKLRMRLDGTLQDVTVFANDIYHRLVSRIKLLSQLKLNVADQPQDGRFSIITADNAIEIRTSTLPAEYGEAIVMRVLNPKNLKNLEALGLRKDVYETFVREIKKPNGIIVVTGPTGSGKTTTLYAFLMKLQTPEIKIITIEDPIEYHVSGVSQTQVAPEKGYTFADGLKSIVRQDPDVILVGEIRDAQTAKISLQAALTGHLVLSTLHSNDAAGTIPRLIDLEEDKSSTAQTISSIASALRMVIGQRLVRKVCATCKIVAAPTTEELEKIKKALEALPKQVEISRETASLQTAHASEKGCEACNFTGYSGRQGIFEVFTMDDELQKFILQNPAVSDLKALLIKKGMATMWQSGMIEVALGNTTLEELEKAVEAG